MSELTDLVAQLLAEQVEEARATQTNPLLEATKTKLHAEFVSVGQPLIKRLQEISASDDFLAVSEIRNRLDFTRLMARGISSDVVGTLDTQLRQFFALHSGTLNGLERIPRRTAALLPEGVVVGRYQEPSAADQISNFLRTAGETVKEIEQRLAGLKRFVVERLVNGPRRDVDMLSLDEPDLMARRKSNPSFQITEA